MRKMSGSNSHFQIGYGIVRILACIMVISHHIIGALYADQTNLCYQKILLVLDNLFMVNNGLFFMMSGKFALEREVKSLKEYYVKRFTKIVLPFLLVAFIQFVIQNTNELTMNSISNFFSKILHGEIYDWFVYAVIGFYLIAPFFGKMLQQLDQMERIILFILLLVCILINTLNHIVGPYIFMNGNPFIDNLVFFMIGYLIDNITFLRTKKAIIICLGCLCAVISCMEILLSQTFNSLLYGPCITRIFMCCGFYVFWGWMDCKKTANRRIVYIISNLTFYIYLFHGIAQGILLSRMRYDEFNIFVKVLVVSVFTFLLSGLMAWILDLVIKTIQKGYRLVKRV